jgi:trigger factor
MSVRLAQAAATGLSLEQVAESLRAHPEESARVDQLAWHLMAVDHVMSQLQVRAEAA